MEKQRYNKRTNPRRNEYFLKNGYQHKQLNQVSLELGDNSFFVHVF